MTQAELEAIRGRHFENEECHYCDPYSGNDDSWRCDAARLLSEVERLRGVAEAAEMADSMLSLLWHRYVSNEARASDPSLSIEVQSAIGKLRAALAALEEGE